MLNIFTYICRNPPKCSEPDQLFRWRGLFVSMSARHHSRLFVRHQDGAGRSEVGGMSMLAQVWIIMVQNGASRASKCDL